MCGYLNIRQSRLQDKKYKQVIPPNTPVPSPSPCPHCLGTGSFRACSSAVSLGKEIWGRMRGDAALWGLLRPCEVLWRPQVPPVPPYSALLWKLSLPPSPFSSTFQALGIMSLRIYCSFYKSRAESLRLAQIPEARQCETWLTARNGCSEEKSAPNPN